jgi:hypothetical protein
MENSEIDLKKFEEGLIECSKFINRPVYIINKHFPEVAKKTGLDKNYKNGDPEYVKLYKWTPFCWRSSLEQTLEYFEHDIYMAKMYAFMKGGKIDDFEKDFVNEFMLHEHKSELICDVLTKEK